MSNAQFSVLLIDDDPHVQNVFELVMSHHQLPLTVLSDAESALVYLQDHEPDVIVLDIFLPGLDGYQTLNQMKKNVLAPASCVVATTAYYTNDTEQDVFQRGFDGYLPKPFDSTKLVDYLSQITKR